MCTGASSVFSWRGYRKEKQVESDIKLWHSHRKDYNFTVGAMERALGSQVLGHLFSHSYSHTYAGQLPEEHSLEQGTLTEDKPSRVTLATKTLNFQHQEGETGQNTCHPLSSSFLHSFFSLFSECVCLLHLRACVLLCAQRQRDNRASSSIAFCFLDLELVLLASLAASELQKHCLCPTTPSIRITGANSHADFFLYEHWEP